MGAARSWTNPFSNHVELAAADVQENLPLLVGVGGTPSALLLPLLHETMHHWCFRSPVGGAIAGIQARTRRRALSLLAGHRDNYDSLLLDFVASRVANAALLPLSEGLAVACEADSFTLGTEYLSMPLRAALRAFTSPTSDEPGLELFLSLDKALLLARKDFAGLRRKFNVYGDLFGNAGEGYLLGYLTVRSAMRRLSDIDARLIRETDLAVGFIREFFYGDWQFVDLLLERDTDDLALAKAITNYVRDRFNALYEVTASDIQEFEERASGSGDRRFKAAENIDPDHARILHYDVHLAEMASQAGEDLIADLNEFPTVSGDDHVRIFAETLYHLDAEVFATRGLVDLGSCGADVEISNGKCTVRLNGKLLLQDVATDHSDIAGPGTIDVCYDTSSRGDDRLLIIAGPDGPNELIAVVRHGPEIDRERQVPRITVGRTGLLDMSRYCDERIDAIVREHFSTQVNHILGQLPAVVESRYLDPAMAFVPDDRLEETLSCLQAGGLLAILGYDRDLAETLAVTGVVCQHTPMRAFVEPELRRRNLSTQLLDDLLNLSNRMIPLVQQENEWMRTFI